MQSSLLAEPADRNIKAADIADSADVAKIVETTALRMDGRQHPRQIPLILRSRATAAGSLLFSLEMWLRAYFFASPSNLPDDLLTK
jgi:hypothetical protein